jgi:hypothetical protein
MNETETEISRVNALLDQPLQVINLGVTQFAETLAAQGINVVQVDWRPPAQGNRELQEMLAALKEKR